MEDRPLIDELRGLITQRLRVTEQTRDLSVRIGNLVRKLHDTGLSYHELSNLTGASHSTLHYFATRER